MNTTSYDVIVVGSGHAGIEAALAAARMGCKTIMFTINIDNIGLMPCNPSIGGPAKGQIVSEIDALGGEMGRAADTTHIQMKILNRSRGPAVQCLRSQNDKREYAAYMKQTVCNQSNLEVRQAMIHSLIFKDSAVCGVVTDLGREYLSKTVIITTGTFLNGQMHIGLQSFAGGRVGEFSALTLSESFSKYLRLGRLKTGTPPRLDSRSIDFTKMTVQPGDHQFLRFSFRTPFSDRYKNQVDCFLTRTTTATHNIILNNLDRSPMYAKVIKGAGPRYCPSIEDKIVRFSDKESHQIFIEPEGRNTNEIYPQGLNTSLPEDVQEALLKTMPGLEDVVVLKPGYAVEYDFVYPDQLHPSLETRPIKNLFLAGQINGTSGYEEAAGQGIIAGINAALKVKGEPALILTRQESYIGTMIDDLITKNIYEPYRMLTSRSEHRLLLRQENATFRLSEYGYRIGLLSRDDINEIRTRREKIDGLIKSWKTDKTPKIISTRLGIPDKTPMINTIRRPEFDAKIWVEEGVVSETDFDDYSTATIEVKYAGYLDKQLREIEKITKQESRPIADDINYDQVLGLSRECREKLKQYRPKTIYEAKKIGGVNPADIIVLLVHLEKEHK
ncbi:tRNA uridine-5-carboxymethylaminomethyl(34) synthesis enzyme MnmG [bacterium]|nr:tRNA uridine-5-carboxymethylaminomethyl(34) synthesis enzyme MnmG [bacterium]